MIKDIFLKFLKILASGAFIYYVVNYVYNIRENDSAQGPVLLLFSAIITVVGLFVFIAIVFHVLSPRNTPSKNTSK